MKKILWIIIGGAVLCALSAGIAFYAGKKEAYTSIISEKCWLNKQTRDIECIYFMAD